MLLSILIINYNTSKELNSCIISIQKYLKDIEHEVNVIDNNSTYRTIKNLKVVFPLVKFDFLNNNIGFGKANNLAAGKSLGTYLLILNPDTEFIEDSVTPIINFLDLNEYAGVCAPMLVYKDLTYQNSMGDKIGFVYEAAEALMFINLYRKIKNWLNKTKLKNKKPFRVGWVSGACMIIKKSLFMEVGGFDSKYFLNYEDIDLCRKIEEKGYKNYYFPGLKCIHLDNTSQKKDYASFVYNRYVSRIIYGRHHYNIVLRFIVNAIHFIGLLFRIVLVHFMYNGIERFQRKNGYLKSLKLYLKR